MKYLQLFESFESDIVSKLLKFLKNDKVNSGIKNYKKLTNDLKTLQTMYDFPISKINDKDVKYIKADKALNIKSEGEILNNWGVYAIKFWFSIDNGYLGYTGIGNSIINYDKYLLNSDGYTIDNEPFSDDEIDYIKNRLDITNGTIQLVKNRNEYKNFKIGTKVLTIIGRRPILGTIYIEENNGQMFIIQNAEEGNRPSGDNWRQYGNYSWSIGNINKNKYSEHEKLHIYKPGKAKLKIINPKEEKSKKEIINPLDFNLPIYNGKLHNWDYGNPDILKESDYCMVVYIDDILKDNKDSIKDIRINRTEIKKDAISLMSDDQIRNLNIDRYFKKIFKDMGFDESNVSDFKNLQKMILNILCSRDIAFFIIFSGRYETIYNLNDYIFQFIKSTDKKRIIDVILNYYKSIKKETINYNKKYIEIFKLVENNNNKYRKDVFKICEEMSNKIYDYFKNSKIETIQDLTIAQYKLDSIHKFCRNSHVNFPTIRNSMDNLYYISDFAYYIERENPSEDDIKSAKEMLKMVNLILKN